LAKLLGTLEKHGEERLRPLLEAALAHQRIGLLDDIPSPPAPPESIAVPNGLANIVIEAAKAADYATCCWSGAPMSDTAQAAVIMEHCKELKLAAVIRDYPALCRQARDGGWAYEELLRELLEAEITNRRQSTARRLLREARFPDVKTLEQVDWAALKGVSRPKILELSSCQYIGQAEDVILAGPIGTGKTMLAIASGSRPRGAASAYFSPVLLTWCKVYWKPEMSDG
jgi:hypothetical protein